MKELFEDIDVDNKGKIDQDCLKTYLNNLSAKFGTPDLKRAASFTEECFLDVWCEIDFRKTGYITWHQIKPFLKRGLEHQLELEEEIRLFEEDRQIKINDVNKRIEEKEAARLAEI